MVDKAVSETAASGRERSSRSFGTVSEGKMVNPLVCDAGEVGSNPTRHQWDYRLMDRMLGFEPSGERSNRSNPTMTCSITVNTLDFDFGNSGSNPDRSSHSSNTRNKSRFKSLSEA